MLILCERSSTAEFYCARFDHLNYYLAIGLAPAAASTITRYSLSVSSYYYLSTGLMKHKTAHVHILISAVRAVVLFVLFSRH
jgi:hypothetical protein